ncbi:MAG TPA: aminoglycoside phosphotransferase family protein [Acidimicrobiia bacterium]
MDRYAPLPTPEQLERLSDDIGAPLTYDYRILGGLGGTMDVLRSEVNRVVLKRYWLPEPDEDIDPAESEYRALALAAEHGIPAPSPLWVDRVGLFPERAVVISFLEGKVILEPADPMDWATQLAMVLVAIHEMRPSPTDSIFPTLGHDDGHTSEKAVLEHPLGADLWKKRSEAIATLIPDEVVYVHHDFWPGNTLWVDESLVAVVDWEGGSIADPALDVANCALDIRLLGNDDVADHFVAAYRNISGRALRNFRYWEINAVCRPMPDVAMWLPGWHAVGLDVSPDQVRRRHWDLIEGVLGRG